ncbi:hypothetical protein LJC22_03540 [Desulfosarcina sp. OttesenSCG-928-G10]|nr:hypothetical protein [Desulfosarcina sp. OttesenSCG-928-G10]MDL2321857.1 hypothetical protein [Desulfosarcina sp. OttesenSCG-928-B08]
MKKMMGLALAVLLVAGMFASVAVADDRLQLNGQMRVRYWNKDYGSNQSQDYFDQRLRVGATLNVADGVKVITRMDLAEGTWGDKDSWDGLQWKDTKNSKLQIDRAYLQVDRKYVSIAAGQQNITLGNAVAYDNQGGGFKVDIKTPVVITLAYTKESEGNRSYDTDNADKDIDTYLINLGRKGDKYSINAYYAAAFDDIKGDDSFEPRLYGAQGTFNAGIFAFNAEVDVFDGDAFGYEVTGVQAWLNVEAKVLDNLKIGADLVWSDGNDDADKIKLTAINDFNTYSFMDRGPFKDSILPGGISDMFDPLSPLMGQGKSWNSKFAGHDSRLTSKSEIGGQGGSIGGGLYAVFTPIEKVDIFAQVMYLEPEDDGYNKAMTGGATNDALWNSAFVYSIGASWMFAPNTTINAQYHRTDWDSDIDRYDDSCDVIAAMLSVRF